MEAGAFVLVYQLTVTRPLDEYHCLVLVACRLVLEINDEDLVADLGTPQPSLRGPSTRAHPERHSWL